MIGTTTTLEATSTTPSSSAGTTTTTIDPAYAAVVKLLPTNVPSGLALQPDRLADTGATNLAKAIQDDGRRRGPVCSEARRLRRSGTSDRGPTPMRSAQNDVCSSTSSTAAGAATYVAVVSRAHSKA